MNDKILIVLVLAMFAMPAAYAVSGNGTVAINITSTNQIIVYTSNGSSDSSMSFIPVAPPAGSSITLQSNYTTNMTANETGFKIENQGNINVSINVSSSVTAADFIGGTSPAFQMWGENSESSSCVTPTAYASRFNLGTSALLCDILKFGDSADTMWAYILITVPSDAPVATQSATITFTATAA